MKQTKLIRPLTSVDSLAAHVTLTSSYHGNASFPLKRFVLSFLFLFLLILLFGNCVKAIVLICMFSFLAERERERGEERERVCSCNLFSFVTSERSIT